MYKGAVKLAPSILAADFARLGEQVRKRRRPGPTGYMSMSWMDTLCPIFRWACRSLNRSGR